jgi:hypothetical protein
MIVRLPEPDNPVPYANAEIRDRVQALGLDEWFRQWREKQEPEEREAIAACLAAWRNPPRPIEPTEDDPEAYEAAAKFVAPRWRTPEQVNFLESRERVRQLFADLARHIDLLPTAIVDALLAAILVRLIERPSTALALAKICDDAKGAA